MVFARVWPPRAAARSWQHGVRAAENVSVRERHSPVAVVERLRRRADFRAATDGARASGAFFVLQARRRADDGAVRVGFTVSRQVGNAVERNRVRRRLREVVRLSVTAGTRRMCPGHDYVLIGRRAALAAPFGEMMLELDAALGRLHTLGGRGTGGARRDRLHEAGSPPRPPKPRHSREKSPNLPGPTPQER
jgi:ribonuclease P protein component